MRGGVTRITLAGTVIVSVLLSACEFEFTPDVVPLELGTAPPESFSERVSPQEQQGQPPFTSADAIDACGGTEVTGDELMGSCLAPGGESYYIWISAEEVLLVSRDDPHIQAFRFAAVNRAEEQGTVDEMLSKWPGLGVLALEFMAAGGTCGGALASGATGVGLVVSAALASGCVASVGGFLWTSVLIAGDAQDLVESAIDADRYRTDAAYNYCRMQGGSDAECRGPQG